MFHQAETSLRIESPQRVLRLPAAQGRSKRAWGPWRAIGWHAVALCALFVVGCGGSASETPPPLEPLPERMRPPKRPAAEQSPSRPEAGRPNAPVESETESEDEGQPTWGR